MFDNNAISSTKGFIIKVKQICTDMNKYSAICTEDSMRINLKKCFTGLAADESMWIPVSSVWVCESVYVCVLVPLCHVCVCECVRV